MGAGDGGLTKLPVPQFAVVGLWDMLACLLLSRWN